MTHYFFSIFIVSVVLIFSSSVNVASAADEWDKIEIALGAATIITAYIDWKQTQIISKKYPYYWEINPLLGKHPNRQQIDAYFLTSLFLRGIVAHHLPKKYRKIWISFCFGVQAGFVAHNYKLGVRIRLP